MNVREHFAQLSDTPEKLAPGYFEDFLTFQE
jgi:hypothetical protein